MAGEAKGSSNQERKVLENSVSNGPLIFGGLIAFFIVLFGELWVLLGSRHPFDPLTALAVGVVFWFAFFFLMVIVMYSDRPKSVEVSDDGVKLNKRWGQRPIIMAWQDILTIELPTTFMGKEGGAIRDDIAPFYSIDHSIAVELREAYHQRMGKYPPERLDDLHPGMEKDMLAMRSSAWNKKYERFKKRD